MEQNVVSFSVGSIHPPSFGSGQTHKFWGLDFGVWRLGLRAWAVGFTV